MAPATTPRAPARPAMPMDIRGNSAARPAALEDEEEPEPLELDEVGEGVKPMGPVWVADAVAADDAEEAAEDAAPVSACSFKNTWSTMCITPFQRMISGVTIFAVTFPLVTNPPVPLNVDEKLSPAELVALVPPWRLPVYTLVPFTTWLRRIVSSTEALLPAAVRFCCAAANAASLGAKIVTPCVLLSVSRKEAEVRADWKEVRLFETSAAVNSPGTSMTASTTWMVKFWNVVELTIDTSVFWLRILRVPLILDQART